MNTLISSTNNLDVSATDQYTLKDNEVAINGTIYKKEDIEISINGNGETINQEKVKVGIHQRDDSFSMCANPEVFNKWQINGVQSTSLGQLVESINSLIK